MRIIKNKGLLQQCLSAFREGSERIGFVPTMGALHEGHTSLVRASREQNDRTIVSIFVNPTQFDEATDLSAYPRTIEADLSLLLSEGVDVVFLPEVAEIYPGGAAVKEHFDFGGVDRTMEGRFRPGHFEGVAQVVKILLDIIRPDCLYLGQKDYQQYLILSAMVRQLALPLEVVMCPIVREANGLAMSSRNRRLSGEQRKEAGQIYRILKQAKQGACSSSPEEVLRRAGDALKGVPGLEPEYIRIVDAANLQDVEAWEEAERIIMCVAVRAGEIRLIDNMFLK